MKRIFLLVVTNLLVMLTLGLIFSAISGTSLGRALGGRDNLGGLMAFSLVWGFGGAFLSLLISRWIARISTGAEILNPGTASGDERWLIDTVYRLAKDSGITSMPEVGIYPGAELNAFATGPSKNSALVCVSEGLLASMNKGEIEGVLGHEISHVANGDMVTMTLVQGVVNSFVMFLSWIITLVITQAVRGKDERGGGFGGYMLRSLIHNLVQMALFFAAYIVVIAPFSRHREFRADEGGAKRAGKERMIAALQALKAFHLNPKAAEEEARATAAAPALAAFKISGDWSSLMSTHPPLDERIARLKAI